MHCVRIERQTAGRGFEDLTGAIDEVVRESGVRDGLCHLFIRHTSASLLVTENADADVLHDLETAYARLAPDGDPAWRHRAEGPDDMSAHVRSALTCTSLTLPVRGGHLALGTWQGVYLWEHRARAHRREIEVTVSG